MVAPAQHFYVKTHNDVRGPFTLTQVAAMWASGNITSDSFYRISNIEEWSPLSQLEETLLALSGGAKPPPIPPILRAELVSTPIAQPVADAPLSISGVPGTGKREDPFVFPMMGHIASTALQQMLIEQVFGVGVYKGADGIRNYHESPRGIKGNKDLCEHVVIVGGNRESLWCDLSAVSEFVRNPSPNALSDDALIQHARAKGIDTTGSEIISAVSNHATRAYTGESCWFSGQPAHRDSALQKPLYFQTYQSFFGRRKEWKEVTVCIPRSEEAAKLHAKQEKMSKVWTWCPAIVGGIIGGIFGGPIIAITCFALSYLLGPVIFVLWLPGTPKDWRKYGDWKEYPSVAKLFSEGWQDRPPA